MEPTYKHFLILKTVDDRGGLMYIKLDNKYLGIYLELSKDKYLEYQNNTNGNVRFKITKKGLDYLSQVSKLEGDISMSSKLHESQRIIYEIEDTILNAFEKYEPKTYDDIDFSISSDYYDNSLEILIKSSHPYPYEPKMEIREEIFKLGFDNVYWNFVGDSSHDEIRNYEPRHYRDSDKWLRKPNEYGYVDDRFNLDEWVEQYGQYIKK